MPDRICLVDGCERRPTCRGMCNPHYQNWYRRGEPAPAAVRWTSVVCGVEGCDEPVKSRGWCVNHYNRWRTRGGDPAVFRPSRYDTVCLVDGCEKRESKRGYCSMHYSRLARYGDLEHVTVKTRSVCSAEGCTRYTQRQGLCAMHFRRRERTGDPLGLTGPTSRFGSDNPAWAADAAGYMAAHQRVRVQRGHASTHACVDCGGRAAEWSYCHDAPEDRRLFHTKTGSPYSLYVEDFQPRCTACHRRYDRRNGVA